MDKQEIMDRTRGALRRIKALPETSQAYLAGRLDCMIEKEWGRVGPDVGAATGAAHASDQP